MDVLSVVVLTVGALASGPARANMGSPIRPGDLPTEPAPALRGLTVVHETLAIDLTGVARGEDARVTATYRVRNDGAARTVPLVFVAPELQEPEVRVDGGAPLPLRPADASALPVEWAEPEDVPTLQAGVGPVRYEGPPQPQVVGFDAPLGAGEHELSVHYAARPGELQGRPYHERRLVYVLAPARRWEGFGTLDVTVALPPGWEAAAAPPLAREGDTLRGRFEGLPADHLAVSVRKPPPDVPTGALNGAAGVLGAVLVVAVSWRVARRGRGGRPLGAAAVIGTVLAAAVAGALLPAVGIVLENLVYDAAELSGTFRFGRMLGALGLAVVAAPTGALLAAVALWLSRRQPA